MLLKKIIMQHVKNFLEPQEQKPRMKMQKNQPQLFVAGSLILHNNAHLRIADVANKQLHDYGWEVLPHAPYSPDISPPDFDLFPKLKEPMRERCFSFLEELPTNVIWAIRHVNESCVLDGIIMLPKHWDLVTEKQRDYIEQIISKK